MKTQTKVRIALTLAILVGISIVNFTSRTASPLISGNLAVAQLENSDAGFVKAKVGTLFNGGGIPALITLALIVAVWIKPVVQAFTASALILLCLTPMLSHAAVMDKDQEEWKAIKPNQSAFLVPAVGANKSSQAQFDSSAYLDSLKIAAKRIQIPHTIWHQAGALAWDKYVPSATLYVVTRQPYARSWQKETTKGTSAKDEGTYLESKEGINIDFGTMISAEIIEKDSALYMYHFGASETIDAGDSAEFPSVVYAKPLSEIMDTVVYMDAHRLLAKEFGKRTFLECSYQKAEIFSNVEAQLVATYKPLGISIRYFGQGSPLNYDQKIQSAVDTLVISDLQAMVVSNQLKTIPVQSALADIAIKNGAATSAAKWDGKLPALPSFMIIPSGIWDKVLGWFSSPKPSTASN